MDNSHPTSNNSIVASVARHEQELLDKIQASKQEAQDIVDQARAHAQKNLLDAEAQLNNDIAAIRREREAVRRKDFDATVQAAEQRLTGVRDEAALKVPGLAEDVLAMFMPQKDGGHNQ